MAAFIVGVIMFFIMFNVGFFYGAWWQRKRNAEEMQFSYRCKEHGLTVRSTEPGLVLTVQQSHIEREHTS